MPVDPHPLQIDPADNNPLERLLSLLLLRSLPEWLQESVGTADEASAEQDDGGDGDEDDGSGRLRRLHRSCQAR